MHWNTNVWSYLNKSNPGMMITILRSGAMSVCVSGCFLLSKEWFVFKYVTVFCPHSQCSQATATATVTKINYFSACFITTWHTLDTFLASQLKIFSPTKSTFTWFIENSRPRNIMCLTFVSFQSFKFLSEENCENLFAHGIKLQFACWQCLLIGEWCTFLVPKLILTSLGQIY